METNSQDLGRPQQPKLFDEPYQDAISEATAELTMFLSGKGCLSEVEGAEQEAKETIQEYFKAFLLHIAPAIVVYGYQKALTDYAVWNNGIQYCGAQHHTLQQAREFAETRFARAGELGKVDVYGISTLKARMEKEKAEAIFGK